MMPRLQIDALREASRSFREYSQGHGVGTVVLLVVVLLLIAALVVYSVWAGRDRLPGRRLFLRLARASRLEKPELRFLLDVARRAVPDNPPALFLRRSLFESTVADMHGTQPQVVASVRLKVYGP
jgi:hypothetical protein